MTPKEFFKLVAKMRQAQRDFFNTRSKDALFTSQRLEREVDAEIKRVNTIAQSGAEQKTLFEQ